MTKRKSGPPRAPRTFTAAFKREAVRLMQERRAGGATLTQAARELDVAPDQLRHWAQQIAAAAPLRSQGRPAPGAAAPTGPEAEADELRRLRREVAVLRLERDFLKKAAAFFAIESR